MLGHKQKVAIGPPYRFGGRFGRFYKGTNCTNAGTILPYLNFLVRLKPYLMFNNAFQLPFSVVVVPVFMIHGFPKMVLFTRLLLSNNAS